MCAFIVLGLVFPYQAKRLAWGTSLKWPVLCRAGCKTTTQSTQSKYFSCDCVTNLHPNRNPTDLKYKIRFQRMQIFGGVVISLAVIAMARYLSITSRSSVDIAGQIKVVFGIASALCWDLCLSYTSAITNVVSLTHDCLQFITQGIHCCVQHCGMTAVHVGSSATAETSCVLVWAFMSKLTTLHLQYCIVTSWVCLNLRRICRASRLTVRSAFCCCLFIPVQTASTWLKLRTFCLLNRCWTRHKNSRPSGEFIALDKHGQCRDDNDAIVSRVLLLTVNSRTLSSLSLCVLSVHCLC